MNEESEELTLTDKKTQSAPAAHIDELPAGRSYCVNSYASDQRDRRGSRPAWALARI
jgi:hypothetical protein